MRVLVLSVSVLCTACLGATCAIAQTGQWGQAEDQVPPYHTHTDRRHGNDHVYPDRGAVLRDVPRGAIAVNYAGISYRFAGGVWYQRLGPAYIVVAPPIGLIVPQLPPFATSFDSAGKTYLYADDAFYRPRPDLGGYEVVNDPEDLAPERSRAAVTPEASPAAGTPRGLQAPHTPEAAQSAAASEAAQSAAASEASQVPAASPQASQAPVSTAPYRVASAAPSPPPAPAQPPVQPQSSMAPPPIPVVAPTNGSPAAGNPTGVAIHPRNGQSLDQQALDRYECYRFAVGQAGFDPLASHGAMSSVEVAQHDTEYSRAQAACLQGRGYTVQ
jgi:hypothetical protein